MMINDIMSTISSGSTSFTAHSCSLSRCNMTNIQNVLNPSSILSSYQSCN